MTLMIRCVGGISFLLLALILLQDPPDRVVGLTPSSDFKVGGMMMPELKGTGTGKVQPVSFHILAGFDASGAEAFTDDQIPEEVRALDGKRVSLIGHMVPLEQDGGMVKKFILARNLIDCCFGSVPAIHEWIYTEVIDAEGTKPADKNYIEVTGTLHVKVYHDATGHPAGIYRLHAESIRIIDSKKK